MTILSWTLKLGSYLVLCFVFPTLADANDWTERPYHAFGLADKGNDLRRRKKGWRQRSQRRPRSLPEHRRLDGKIDPFTPYRVMFQYRSSSDLKNFQVSTRPRRSSAPQSEMPASKTGVGTLSN